MINKNKIKLINEFLQEKSLAEVSFLYRKHPNQVSIKSANAKMHLSCKAKT